MLRGTYAWAKAKDLRLEYDAMQGPGHPSSYRAKRDLGGTSAWFRPQYPTGAMRCRRCTWHSLCAFGSQAKRH